MTFSRKLLLLCVAALLIAPQVACVKQDSSANEVATTAGTQTYGGNTYKSDPVAIQVKAKLDQYARNLVQKSNNTITPNKKRMAVRTSKGQYTAQYKEIALDSVTTEIYASDAPGSQYVGHVVYLEKTYECTAKTKAAAVKGPFKAVKARRVRELARYDQGKWQ